MVHGAKLAKGPYMVDGNDWWADQMESSTLHSRRTNGIAITDTAEVEVGGAIPPAAEGGSGFVIYWIHYRKFLGQSPYLLSLILF